MKAYFRLANVVSLLALFALLAACGDSNATPTTGGSTSPATATSGSSSDLFGRNLLVNGDGEASTPNGPCSLDAKGSIPGWKAGDNVLIAAYGSASGEPDSTMLEPTDKGVCYFRDGVFGGEPAKTNVIFQVIEVEAIAADIDAGKVRYTLSGYFGGFGGDSGTGVLKASFEAPEDEVKGTAATDPVAPADRNSETKLIKKETPGTVPPGTRIIEIDLQMQSAGCENCSTVAMADSLVFMLNK